MWTLLNCQRSAIIGTKEGFRRDCRKRIVDKQFFHSTTRRRHPMDRRKRVARSDYKRGAGR